MPGPKLSTEQMLALHGFFSEAAVAAECALSEQCGCESEIEVTELHCTSLADLGEEGLRVSEEVVAGVMGRVEGAMPGSIALALDPEEALGWARSAEVGDPLQGFMALARELLGSLVAAFAEVLERGVTLVDPRLVESPELAMLARTHAPLDTLVLSLQLRVELQDEMVAAHVHLLVEPKYMARLLSGLSAAVH